MTDPDPAKNFSSGSTTLAVPSRFPRLSSPEAVSSLRAALSVPLAILPASDQEAEGMLRSYMEANSASLPCALGHDMDEEGRMLILLYLVSLALKAVKKFDRCFPFLTI